MDDDKWMIWYNNWGWIMTYPGGQKAYFDGDDVCAGPHGPWGYVTQIDVGEGVICPSSMGKREG